MRILITGSTGFIGNYIKELLVKDGHEVIGVSLHESGKNSYAVDLLNFSAVFDVLCVESKFDLVIHAAALAHGQKLPKKESYSSINTRMTSNIIKSLKEKCDHVIFLSSVAVYKHDLGGGVTYVNSPISPSSDYGQSKTLSEKLVLESTINNVYILRLTPVFDELHMNDISKRVFLPGTNIKFKTSWDRSYSLCKINALGEIIKEIMYELPQGKWAYLVTDGNNYDQLCLNKMFPGDAINIPKFPLLVFVKLTKYIPFKFGAFVRENIKKLFKSNIYVCGKNNIQP